MVRPGVGLIGCGHIGRFHSRNVRAAFASGQVEGDYIAVCDRVIERAESFAAITGAPVVSVDWQDLLATRGLNTVYVCTETAEHPAIVLEAARRGLHVFCEKPLAKTVDVVREMAAAVEAAGVTNQVGLVLRHSPIYTVLRDLSREADLGPLLTAHMRDDQFFPIRGHYGSRWRSDFERAGGGTLIEHSIHDIDVFRWFFGEVDEVRCRTRVTSGHPGIEDVATVSLTHTSGVETTLSSVWHSIDERPSTRRFEIFFEGGWFATDHDFLGPIRYQLRSGPEQELTADAVRERYVALAGLNGEEASLAQRGVFEDLAFLRAVASGSPAHPDFATALRAHDIVDACY
ncbi:MAG: Gfo/Idh/MocA family protein, partial [Dehalococcoidia bacterium]